MEKKEIESEEIKSGELILNMVYDKSNKVREAGYCPQTLVISVDYHRGLIRYINSLYSNCIITGYETILGLNIVLTEIPEIIQVF